jgi:hypothetical protein
MSKLASRSMPSRKKKTISGSDKAQYPINKRLSRLARSRHAAWQSKMPRRLRPRRHQKNPMHHRHPRLWWNRPKKWRLYQPCLYLRCCASATCAVCWMDLMIILLLLLCLTRCEPRRYGTHSGHMLPRYPSCQVGSLNTTSDVDVLAVMA